MLRKKRINEILFFDRREFMYPVLYDTCYIFAQAEINFCSFLAGKRRRTSGARVCAAACILVCRIEMALSCMLGSFLVRGGQDCGRDAHRS